MASQIWDRKVVTVSGLTGTNNVDMIPFNFSTYGITTLVRCTIDVDIIALPTVVSVANNYPEYFCGKYIFDYKVTGGVVGAIVANNVPLNNQAAIHYTPTVTSGNFNINAAGQATALTWNIVFAAVIRSWLERP
jgi:hypothetical protein